MNPKVCPSIIGQEFVGEEKELYYCFQNLGIVAHKQVSWIPVLNTFSA
jgi:hypothetical protein